MTTPEAEQAAAEAREVAEIAAQLVIDSPDMYELAGDQLRAVKAAAKRVEETRRSMTVPLDAAKKAVMDFFRPFSDRLAESEAHLKRGMSSYLAEIERQRAAERAAEEARRRAEAEEAARLLEQIADPAEAAAVAAESELLAALPVYAVTTAPTAAGISTRETWRAEVVDFAALVKAAAADAALLSLLLPNTAEIGTRVRATKGETAIPGIRAYSETTIAARTK
jgi:hypothetical protein